MKKTDFDQDLIKTLRSLKTNADVNPSVLFKENTKVRLMNLISEEKPITADKHIFVFFRNPALAFRTAGIFFLMLLILSTGTILAAQSATPKNKLYPVKLESEKVLLNISLVSSWKAKLSIEIVKRRADEIDSEKKSGNKPEIEQGITRYKNSIQEAKKFNHESLLRDDEQNLESLTTEYDDSTTEKEVGEESDSNINPSGQSQQQEGETKLPDEQQNNNQETIREGTKTNVERETQKVIFPQTSEEN